jgi:hypothetical protein
MPGDARGLSVTPARIKENFQLLDSGSSPATPTTSDEWHPATDRIVARVEHQPLATASDVVTSTWLPSPIRIGR